MRYNTMFTVTEDEKEKTADIVTGIITDEYEKSLIRHFIKESYPLLTESEIDTIEKYSLEEMKKGGIYESHRERVKREVSAFVSENKAIIPKGFVHFRMRDVYTHIKKMVFYGGERFFKEKEYEEFICLLKMFIQERESREDVIHIINHEDEIRLLNKRGRDVTEKYEAEFIHASEECGAKSEDLAVSAIISIAPKKIRLHNLPENSPLAATLKRIYGKNAQVCSGCIWCKKG